MYCYSNNGQSMRAVANNHAAADGEVLFAHEATAEELAAAFPGYAAAQKELKIAALDAEYQSQFTELGNALNLATLAEDTNLIAELKTDYAALKAEYAAKLEAIG
jgi:hypothetical protein